MSIELRILSGARAGHTESFDKSVIAIGRHPMSDFRFDPKQDLDVSTRHGEIRFVSGRYSILDSNSTNGTFVNGQRVTPGGTQELRDKDVIAFGAHGPTVSVGLVGVVSTPADWKSTAEVAAAPMLAAKPPEKPPAAPAAAPPAARPIVPSPASPPPSVAASAPAKAAPSAPASPSVERPSGKRPRRNTAERVAVAVREQTRRLWFAIVVIVVVLGGTAGGIFIKSARDKKAAQDRIDALVAKDSTLQTQLQAQVRGDTALANQFLHVRDSLMLAVKRAKSASQMEEAEQALRKNHDFQQQITQMDFAKIHDANDPAIVLIASDMGGTAPLEATGFAVRSSGVIVTNRHVVADSTVRSSNIRVKFANTGRWYRAHTVKLPDNGGTDLALIQIDEGGRFPTVATLAPSVDAQVSAPVATIGFPLGTDLPMDGSAAKTTMTFGNVSKAVPDLLQIDAFASHGSSGSPVFDAHGHVIGVVWGGPPGGGGRIVFSVPVDRLNELLRGVR